MDRDGLLDRCPESDEHEGEVILQNVYGSYNLPDWAYDLNFNLGWWCAPDGNLIDSEGKKIVGANPDGTYILEDEQ